MSDDPLDYPGRPPRVVPADTFVASSPPPIERPDTTDTGPTPTVDLIGGEPVSGAMGPGASTGGEAGGAVAGPLAGDAAFPPDRQAQDATADDDLAARGGVLPTNVPGRVLGGGDEPGPGVEPIGHDDRVERTF